jgi:opacity protein-like surface antigen
MLDRSLIAVAVVATLLAAFSAQSQEPDYARSGAYGELAAGGALEAFDGVSMDDGFAIGLTVGYRFHPYIAAEGQFEYAKFDDEFLGDEFDIYLITFTTNAKVFVLTGRIQPYGLVGVGLLHREVDTGPINSDDAGFISRFGGGIDFWATEFASVGFATTYVLTTNSVEDTDYVSLTARAAIHF